MVIGRGWLTATDRQGKRRLDDPQDFVRLEITTALTHDVRTIPVLVDGATMPAAADLPTDIQALVRRNAVELSHARFASDTGRLARALIRSEDEPKPGRAPAVDGGRSSTAPAVDRGAVARRDPLPPWRMLAVAATVFAIISSGSIAGLWLAPDATEWWFLKIGPVAQIWVALNVMAGPALAAKLWLPRLSVQQFLGILGATFAALVAFYALPLGLQPIFSSYFPADPDHGTDTLLWTGFVGIPVSAGSGLVLGYFLAQALRGWFPDDGGPGFVPRMVLIWVATGTACSIVSLLVSTLGEAAIVRAAGAEAASQAQERMRMWSDTVIFGLAWAFGLLLTLRFAARSGAGDSASRRSRLPA